MTITFQPLNESHLPLLLKWLESPHVKKWWDPDITYTIDLVREKYSSYLKGYKLIAKVQKPIRGFIICFNQNPIGYIQIYNAYDFPRSKPLFGLPQSLGAIDIFIGEEGALKQGLGSKAISGFLRLHGKDYSHIFVDPDSNNIATIKCYEKAGFKKVVEQKDTGEVWMLWKKEASWDLYYVFEDVVHKEKDNVIKKLLEQFDIYDFLSMPIVFDLIDYKKIRLLKLLYNKSIPLNYEEECGANALHVACGASGNLESVKFFVENNILQDIHKKSFKYGDTPLTLAISYEHKNILEYFKRKFGINSISVDNVDIILDRVKANYRKSYMRKQHFKKQ
jgi:aminoglycoside 6'-N-acetyltransferase